MDLKLQFDLTVNYVICFMDSVQCQSKFLKYIFITIDNIIQNLCGKAKYPEQANNSEKEKQNWKTCPIQIKGLL